jgi:expansin (peptidoglycan-binding protein)
VRIVTTGVSNARGDMDLSREAFELLGDDGVRKMSWQLARCPASSGNLALQFQTGAHTDWTSFWVRNPRLPVAKVEVKSSRHSNFVALRRETDGTWNDDAGFGPGSFTLRLTATTGETAELTQPSFEPGGFVTTNAQL